jgi:peroxiredoxin
LPFSKKIKESFENEDLVFLYISIDEDLESWKNAIVKNNISGIHLSAPGFDHAVCSLYNVSGVPSYFLIDKTGRILNNNPPRPSDGESLTEMLKTALKK